MADVSNSKAQKIGENVTVELTDDQVIIRIDRKHRGEVSASGKTIRVASSLGNKPITADGIILGLNAYVYSNQR